MIKEKASTWLTLRAPRARPGACTDTLFVPGMDVLTVQWEWSGSC